MSLRVLHLASVNYMLKRLPTSLYPDPLALVNLGDLNSLSYSSATSFLEDVLHEYNDFNLFDNIAIRTSESTMEHARHRPFKLYLETENYKQNAHHAYEIFKIFVQQNPTMEIAEAWLVFGMSIKELFSGNVSSDVYWPGKVLMEVTSGPLEPLAKGKITRPESWFLEKETGRIKCKHGDNSPVVERFLGKKLSMKKIEDLMEFASKMPCTLEFIYGYIKEISEFASLIIDVRVMPNVEWNFCGTKAIWKVANSSHFVRMLATIAFIAAKNDHLVEKREESSLVIGPKGSIINSPSKEVSLRSLFGVEVFSPYRRNFEIYPLF